MDHLAKDPAFTAATFIVIDFVIRAGGCLIDLKVAAYVNGAVAAAHALPDAMLSTQVRDVRCPKDQRRRPTTVPRGRGTVGRLVSPACTLRAGATAVPSPNGGYMGSLTEDPVFLATTWIVIDFESTTPRGYPAQPIEVAALGLRYQQRAWKRVGASASLMRPPAFAPVTPADTAQTGLTAEQVSQAPSPAEVLDALDRRLTAGPYLLVAQHAATEAGIIHNQREHCPMLARTDFIDTIPLAKQIIPGLPNYKLDTLLAHYAIPQPPDRHRAGADVEVTAELFFRLIRAADEHPQFSDLAALVKVAGRTAKSNIPVQAELF
jgi:DNA polymerase III subunit epsilon